MPRYQFLPMSAADLPLVRRWLAAPHVTEWWGDPDEQFELVSEDLEQPAMDQFVVTIDGRPFAYFSVTTRRRGRITDSASIRRARAASISSSASRT